MKKYLYFLLLLGNCAIAGGTRLITLRESEETDFAAFFKKKEVPRYSSSEAKQRFDRLHSSEEGQVVAAWLQIKWLQDNGEIFKRMENSDRWKVRGDRVERLLRLLAQAPLYEESISELYKACFTMTELKDRCVPGCGNRPVSLLRPELFAKRMSFGK